MHRREHRSILAAGERRLLSAIARRLPAAITSDRLTLLALVSMIAAGVFRLSFAGVGPTELRILIAVAAIRVAHNPIADVPVLGPIRLLDIGGAIGVAALSIVFVISAIRNMRALYHAEPLPAASARTAA